MLNGLTILVPECRQLDYFAGLLEKEGAAVLRCPLVGIRDLEDTAECESWIEQLIDGAFQDVIWLTGEGLCRLLSISERRSRRLPFVEALGRVRAIIRGPKPARALREIGLAPALAASPPTSQGVLDVLAKEEIADRSIGVQLYPGGGALPLLESLRQRGAVVFPVTPYRYASQAEANQVAGVIRMLIDGRIGMIAFTSSPQVMRLLEAAREAGLEGQLRQAFARVRIAAIGPVVEETLRSFGIREILRPESNFHLKPLVRAIGAAWNAGRELPGEQLHPVRGDKRPAG